MLKTLCIYIVYNLKKKKLLFLDLDWEYPGSRDGSNPDTDKELFTTLCSVTRKFHVLNY
jgi:GH18 family chitinase